MKNKIVILFLFSLLTGNVFSRLSVEDYHFTCLTTKEGMAQNMVNDIYRDSRGFMWFATWNGLNRFDGYEFIRYGRHTEENSIRSLFVRTLIEDDFSTIWIGTEEGISRIDLWTGNIKEGTDSSYKDHPLFAAPVNVFCKDQQGNIWVGFDGGLALVTFSTTGDIHTIHTVREDVDVLSLFATETGQLWIGYRNGGIQILNRVSENTFQLDPAPETLPVTTMGEIFCFCPDEEWLWIGTARGLFKYNQRNGEHLHYVNDPLNPATLIQDYVKDVALDKDGNLIIATYKGIAVLDKKRDEFLQIAASPGSNGLNNNFCSSLFVDEGGTIWIGTEKGGVNKMDKKGDMFVTYKHVPRDPATISPNPVNAIYEDSNGTIWVGTVEGGLNKFYPDSGTFTHYKQEHNRPNSLSHNTVCYITEGDGYLWVATWGGGINRMPLHREGYFEHSSSFVREGAFRNYFISGLVYDEVLHGLWVTSNSGLDFLDLDEMKVIPVLHSAIPEMRISSAAHLFLDTHRNLWIGTEKALHSINLNLSEVREGKVISKRYKMQIPGRPYSENDKINCIYGDKKGTLWIGTYGNGLFRMELTPEGEEVFTNFGTDAGLVDTVVFAIEEDVQGNVWLSSNNGLSCLDPVTGLATSFTEEDGLSANQFYWTSSCRSRDGRLLFGCIDGMLFFDPEKVQVDTSVLQVSIVGGWVNNEPISLQEVIKDWTIHEKDRSFSISFSALYYPSPEKIRYSYILEGFDRNWTEVDGSRRFVNYTNLSAGKYNFRVKCTNPDGTWSDLVTQVHIRIVPPFYKEKWFIGLILLFLLFSIYAFNDWKVRSLRKQKLHLEKMVVERTEKVESQKNRLEQQAKDLEKTLQELIINQKEISRQNRILVEKNDEISRQKDQLEELSNKLQQATQDKINFFTNITHEFKTPLTLILGPIEQALSLSVNPKVIEQLQLVHKNSKYLLSLINQLMDFRKADTQALKVNKTPGNFQDFLRAIVSPFDSLTKPRNVSIHEYIRFPYPCFRFDPDLMQKVVVNLLSNAVKFTPDGGQISLYASLLSASEKGMKYLYISVTDSGTGIPEEKMEKLFEPFFQLENKSIYPVYGQSGTGIGLYLSHQIIEQLGGTIRVKNKISGGASFRVVLPLEPVDMDVDAPEECYVPPELYDRPAVEESYEPEDRDKPFLLIVEDNPDMRAFVKSILKDHFTVLEAPDGESGLQKTVNYLPDFIISDIMMPVMDGLEFCKKVKNNFVTSHIPVLLLTAKSSTDVRIEGYNAGADGYISKPFSADLLLARINNMIESRRRAHRVFEKSLDVKTLDIHEESQDRVFLDKLMEIVQENYRDATFDVADLQNKMHISKSFLHKKLQSLIGQPAVKVIRSYRLTKAKELIESCKGGSSPTISEIAYEVGFNDPKYFTRCFTKQFGISPSGLLDK